jgi:hypothetical protein
VHAAASVFLSTLEEPNKAARDYELPSANVLFSPQEDSQKEKFESHYISRHKEMEMRSVHSAGNEKKKLITIINSSELISFITRGPVLSVGKAISRRDSLLD